MDDDDVIIGFSFMGDNEVERLSVCTINRPNYGDGEGELYDRRMGPRITGQDDDENNDNDSPWKGKGDNNEGDLSTSLCITCEEPPNRCVGHYGKIDLPIYVTINSRLILYYLKCFCFTCRLFLVPPNSKPANTKHGIEDIKGFLCVIGKMYENGVCYSCETIQPKVKQVDDDHFTFGYKKKKSKTWTQITHGPIRVREILENIPNSELIRMLNLFEDNKLSVGNSSKNTKNRIVSRPENLFIKTILVPPNNCRPKKSCKDLEAVGGEAVDSSGSGGIIGCDATFTSSASSSSLSCDNSLSGALQEIIKACTFIYNKQFSQLSSFGDGVNCNEDDEIGKVGGNVDREEEEEEEEGGGGGDTTSIKAPPAKRRRRRLNVFGVSKDEEERENNLNDASKKSSSTTTAAATSATATATRGKGRCFFSKEFANLRNKVRDFYGNTPISSSSTTSASSNFGGGSGSGGIKRPDANVKSILDRKQGLYRNNVSGKRANCTARTVITTGAHLKIGEVGIPKEMAPHLQTVDFVNSYNRLDLTKEALIGALEIIPEQMDENEEEKIDEDEDDRSNESDNIAAKRIIDRCNRLGKTLPEFFGTGVHNRGSEDDRNQKRKITIIGENEGLRKVMLSKRFYDVETGYDVPEFTLSINHFFLFSYPGNGGEGEEEGKDDEMFPVLDLKTPWQEYLGIGDKIVDITNGKVYEVRILNKGELNEELREAELEMYYKRLTPGTRVLRNLREGSNVQVNRQPTLHRQSIQAMIVKLTKDSTIKLNPVQTPAFHADFDGDEMNVTVGSTHITSAEINILSGAKNNLISDEARKPSVVFIQDAILTAFVMTGGSGVEERGNRERFMDVLTHANGFWKRDGDFSQRIKDIKVATQNSSTSWDPYASRHLWSFVFPQDFFFKTSEINILDGILIEGTLKKNVLNEILIIIYTNYDKDVSCDFIDDGQAITNAWQDCYGHSISITDCF